MVEQAQEVERQNKRREAFAEQELSLFRRHAPPAQKGIAGKDLNMPIISGRQHFPNFIAADRMQNPCARCPWIIQVGRFLRVILNVGIREDDQSRLYELKRRK